MLKKNSLAKRISRFKSTIQFFTTIVCADHSFFKSFYFRSFLQSK